MDDPYNNSQQQQQSLGPVEELYDDIYDDLSGPTDNNIPTFFKLLGGGGSSSRGGGGFNNKKSDGSISKLNIGIPKRTYLTVTKINSRIDSYRYSMIEATRGKAVAASELRNKGFMDTFVRALGITSSSGSSSSSSSSGSNEEREEEGQHVISLTQDPSQLIIVDEPSVLGGDGLANSHVFGYHNDNDNSDGAITRNVGKSRRERNTNTTINHH
jgi:hypothetical protein